MSDSPGGDVALPLVRGRRPRIALLVYNHAHNDSRVLKTAASLRAAGARVRVFAVARQRSGYAEGPGLVGDGIEVDRAPEFELVRYAAGRFVLRIARRLTGRQASTPGVGGTGAPRTAADARAGVPATNAPRRVGIDVWLRTYRTLSLGLYWWHAAHAAALWKPDVIHANDGNTLAPALWVARESGAQVVYDSHELWLRRNVRGDRPIAPCVEALVEKWGVRRAAGVITVSPSIAAWLQQRYRLPRRPTLVRNAPRAQKPEPSASTEGQGRLRELAGLTDSDRVIAYGGRITTSRGIEETLQALTWLPSNVHFVLLGYGEADYLATVHVVTARHAVAQRVHLVGAVAADEVSAALADADVSVVYVRPICTSYEFSLPNKLFESIHAGVPVVAADLPDTAALVREHGVGDIFTTDDPADMARTIASVLDHPQAYRSAARDAASILTWQHEEAALLALYADVLGDDTQFHSTTTGKVSGQ